MSIYVDIEKKLGSFHLNVKFEAADETLALLGASGCGKSMTLRCIAGVERPDYGKIVVDGVTLFDSEKKINLTPQQRRTGLLFQNYALFPSMTVAENIRAGAKREKDKAKREQAVSDVMERFGLAGLGRHYPAQLSGGQQQRVALARILVSQPRILLLDEPFSALDSHLRFRLEQEVREVIHRFGKTVILVSHDRGEVFRMSDSIAVMCSGMIEVQGGKEAVFAAPQTTNGAVLTGCKNISAVRMLDHHHIQALDWGVTLALPEGLENMTAVGIRMHDVREGTGENSVLCRVVEEIENPFSYTVMLRPVDGEGTTPIGWELDKQHWRQIRGEQVQIHLPAQSLLMLRG